jgi:hypothetical protein
MNRLAELAAKLYPASWRARYGREFQALLDDASPGMRDAFDILREAILMHLTNAKSYARMAAVVGAAGAVAAFGLSFAMPDRYRSSAALTSMPPHEITEDLFSRSSLAELIQRPSLDLYRSQRAREPMVDVIEEMRRDLRIRQTQAAGSGVIEPAKQWVIEFDYPNRYKARAVVRDMTARLESAENRRPDGPVMLLETVVGPNRLQIAGWGLLIGIFAAALAGIVSNHPRRWTLGMAGFGAAGLALAGAVSYAIPSTYVSSALVRARPGFALDREAAAGPLLADLVRKHDLYGRDTRAAEQLRRNLAIARVSPTGAREASYTITFAHTDREKAQAVVRDAIQALNRWDRLLPVPNAPDSIPRLNAQVIDPAFLPDLPSSPNRALVALIGLLTGLAMGWIALRRQARHGVN